MQTISVTLHPQKLSMSSLCKAVESWDLTTTLGLGKMCGVIWVIVSRNNCFIHIEYQEDVRN